MPRFGERASSDRGLVPHTRLSTRRAGEKVDYCTNLISMNTYRRDDRFGGIEGRLSRLIKENEDDLRRHEAESVLFHWPAGARPSVGDPRRAR